VPPGPSEFDPPEPVTVVEEMQVQLDGFTTWPDPHVMLQVKPAETDWLMHSFTRLVKMLGIERFWQALGVAAPGHWVVNTVL
jgi:hypothetical protein